MLDLFFKLAYTAIKFYSAALTRSIMLRLFTVTISTLFIVLAIGITINQKILMFSALSQGDFIFSISALFFAGLVGYTIVIISKSPNLVNIWSQLDESMSSELQPIRTERREIQERILHQKEPNIFDTIQLSLNQLNEYYTINKAQPGGASPQAYSL
jgi:hypothetical protein